MTRYNIIKTFSLSSGYSEAAIRAKISRGDWPEGQVWARAPDNRILINVKGFEDWVVNRRALALGDGEC